MGVCVIPVVDVAGPVVMKSSHPGGSRGVQSGGLGLVLPRVLFVLPVLPGPGLVLPVSVRVLFVLPVLPGPGLVLPVSVRPGLPGPGLVLPVSVRLPGPSVLLRPRVRVLSLVGHSVTGGQVHS